MISNDSMLNLESKQKAQGVISDPPPPLESEIKMPAWNRVND